MGTKQEQFCRFAVLSENGRRSGIWRIWTSASSKKSDVYLTSSGLHGSVKVSLHQSGQYRVSFTKEFLDRISKLGTWERESRHLAEWLCPKDLDIGVTRALRIVVPTSEVIVAPIGKIEPRSVIWVPAPPLGKAIQFSVVLTAPNIKVSGWPGRRHMATKLIAQMPLPNSHALWVVYHTVDTPQGALDNIAKLRAYSTDHPEKLVRLDSHDDIDFSERHLRALSVGKDSEGGYLIEAAFYTSRE